MCCPVCGLQECQYWKLRQRESWHPVPGSGTKFIKTKPAEPGSLYFAGQNPDGSHREFFVHPDDAARYEREGLEFRGGRYSVKIYGTVGNGDVQIIAKLEEAA